MGYGMPRPNSNGEMRILNINHPPDSGPGTFLEPLNAARVELVNWRPTEAPEPPAPVTEFDALLSLAGSANPDQDREFPWLRTEKKLLREALRRKIPMLGVGLGAELIAVAAGASVRQAAVPEIGWYQVELTAMARRDPVLGFLPTRFEALQWHSYALALPDSGTELARGNDAPQAFRIGSHAWALQFNAHATEHDFRRWLAQESNSESARSLGTDVEELAEETLERLAVWQEIGQGICERFLAVVSEAREERLAQQQKSTPTE